MPNNETLRELIVNAKGDRSYRRLSIDCGGKPDAQRLHQLATGEARAFPDPETINGLARGTGRTVTAVVLAAARSVGLAVHDGTDPAALVIGGAAVLRPDQRAVLRDIVRTFTPSINEGVAVD